MPSRGARYADGVPFNVGLPELMIVLVIALIVLGPKKLPSFGRSLGAGMREFRETLSGGGGSDRDRDRREDDDDTYALR
jgi:sec-independent protein translocase protein TatA